MTDILKAWELTVLPPVAAKSAWNYASYEGLHYGENCFVMEITVNVINLTFRIHLNFLSKFK